MPSDQDYFFDLAAAFVRGHVPDWSARERSELVEAGVAAGLRLFPFKRSTELPRIRHAIGMVQALWPRELLDVGTGRGAFLWPLLDAGGAFPVVAIDVSEEEAGNLAAVRRGGIHRLSVLRMHTTRLAFADGSFDGVTALEVLEHLPAPELAALELVRVARRFILVSVPSREDDNPEHIHLFDRQSLSELLLAAGAARVRIDEVPGHFIALAHLG